MRLFVALFFVSLSSHAAIIQVGGAVGWGCMALFEPGRAIPGGGCAPSLERGNVIFTYDTSVPDVDASTAGLFPNAITSFDMTIEQQRRPDLHWVLTDGLNQIMVAPFTLGIRISVTLEDLSGGFASPVNFSFGVVGIAPFPPAPDALLPGLHFWQGSPFSIGGGATGLQAVAFGIGQELDWAPSLGAQEITEPATLALLLLGLLGLGFRRSQ